MYSDMSTRIRADASANRNLASARASSVLPTPVGPEKMNEPIGRFGSLSPARERRMARDTALMASSWPTTDSWSSSSIRIRRAVSASWSRVTGMPVQRDTMKAMASSSMTGRRVCRSFSHSSCLSRIWFCRSRSWSRSEAARSKFWSRTASSFCDVHLLQRGLELRHFGRRNLRRQPRPGAGLIDHVDRLVRQEPIGDVALGQLRRRAERGVGDADPVMVFVLLAQTLQDLDRLGNRRRLDHDGLEAPLERAVLLDVLAVLVQGRGAHALQLAPGQRGLQHVGGVDGAFGGAGAHQRVQLIDEEDDLLVLGDLVHDRLEPLLELAPILGAGDDRGHIEREHPVVAQHVGAEPVGNEQRQPFDDGRLADAGLADEHRVVLLPAGQDLHDPLDLLGPADRRIELALRRELRQIAAEMVECGGLGLLLRLGRRAGLGCCCRRPRPGACRCPADAGSPPATVPG